MFVMEHKKASLKGCIKKFLMASLCLSIIPTSMPTAFLERSASAEGAAAKAFVTKDELFGYGLDGEKPVGRIEFGDRPHDVEFSAIVNDEGEDVEDKLTAGEGPINWLIAGKDGDNGLVLYSEEPILGKGTKFSTATENETTWTPNGSQEKETVYRNHWGASNLRETFNELFGTDRYFTTGEQELMEKSEIETYDVKNKKNYPTTDTLYVPAVDYEHDKQHITVGSKDNLKINNSFNKGMCWLRTPADVSLSYVLLGGAKGPTTIDIDDTSVAASAAFKLDMTDLLFASAIPAKAMDGYLSIENIENNLSMTLRFKAPKSATAKVAFNEDKTKLVVTDAKDYRLIVQGVNNGDSWAYIKAISNNSELISIDTIKNSNSGLKSLNNLEGCKVWIEKTEDRITRAIMATGYVTDVKFAKDKETMAYGDKLDLKAIIDPENASDRSLKWASDNEKIATVDDKGQVTAVGIGTATITATSNDNEEKSASCEITVTKKPLTAIVVGTASKVFDGKNNVTDAKGLRIQLNGVVEGDDVTATAKTYLFADSKVGNHKITAAGITLSGSKAGNYVLPITTVTSTSVIGAIKKGSDDSDKKANDSDKKGSGSGVKTGDNVNAGIVIGLMALSVLSGATSYGSWKKLTRKNTSKKA